jgi:hypothetical protein
MTLTPSRDWDARVTGITLSTQQLAAVRGLPLAGSQVGSASV